MRLARIWTLFVAICLVVSTGCKEDPMVRARAAHATERADEAEKALDEVLSQNPKDFEARRLMADVHRFRGEYEKTEAALEELWKEKGFDQDKEFPPEERAQRDLLENQFNELYARWSESLDPAKQPEKFEKVVRAGLKWNKKSPTLNNLLVDHYLARAAALEKEGKKLAAADAYEQVLEFRALVSQRKDAEAKASALRKDAFADAAKTHFETLKEELQAAEQWDAETGTVSFTIEAEVNRRLRQSKDEDLAKARKEAAETLRTALAQWVAKLTGTAPEIAAMASPKMGSGDEKLSRGSYSVKVSMLLDDVIDAAFAAKQKADAAKEKAEDAAKPEEPTEEAPAGTNSGAEEAGTTGAQ